MIPKFVQIIVSGAGRHAGPHLYGLTHDGEVWSWEGHPDPNLYRGSGGWRKCETVWQPTQP